MSCFDHQPERRRPLPGRRAADHQNEPTRLSRLTRPGLIDQKLGFLSGYPLILVFFRGFFCPRDQQQMRVLVQFQGELAVNYGKLAAVSFTNLVIVAAIAFSVPLLLGFAPRLRLPATMLEILARLVLGPSILGWVGVDTPIQILALIGVAFILFLAGLEIDFERPRGRPLLLAGVGSMHSSASRCCLATRCAPQG